MHQSGEASIALGIFPAACVDGDRRLTDLAAHENFSMHAAARLPRFRPRASGDGEVVMLRADRSVAIMTGMIIAALYVILLVGFSRESYMRRDAARRTGIADAAPALMGASGQACRPAPPRCAGLLLKKP
jgi:hypothetical protein